ncbi:MAG: GNAT family N-acetyltransferase [Candidatus Eiseniibacteriota bacterium]
MSVRSPAKPVSTKRASANPTRPKISVVPLTAERWPDLEKLFGPRGAYGGCWCMFFRQTRAEYSAGCGEPNRRAFRRIVKEGSEPGLLAYAGSEPVGWCALAPREEYSTLARARTLKPVDDEPVWSIVCFYVARGFRGRGISVALLEAAAGYVKKRGGRVLEGYPNDPKSGPWPDAYAYHGTVSAFRKAGFTEVKRVSPTRAIMRQVVGGRVGAASRKRSNVVQSARRKTQARGRSSRSRTGAK